jgi:hypothetical protein
MDTQRLAAGSCTVVIPILAFLIFNPGISAEFFMRLSKPLGYGRQ